jgi:Putative Flp pilus-assembly TadE/G-like
VTRLSITRRRDETGVFLILWAILLVALVIMIAIVIDLSNVRSTRRSAQTVADFAALASGKLLATGDPVGGCNDAFGYVVSNTPDLPSGASMAGPAGCSNLTPPLTGCNAATPMRQAVATGTGRYTVTVEWPIPDSQIVDAAYGGSPGPNDGTDQCIRMRVRIRRTNERFFASIVGVDPDSNVSAVARAAPKVIGTEVPALLILERTDCGAFQVSGQGRIEAFGFNTKPGLIHTDSDASGCPSSTALNASNYVDYATKTPSAGLPAIVADPAELPGSDGNIRPGKISVVANAGTATQRAHAAAVVILGQSGYRGIQPTPVDGKLATRGPVDTRYLSAMSALRSDAAALSTPVPPAGFQRLSLIFAADPLNAPLCTNINKSYVITAPKVLIDCDLNLKGSGTNIVFSASGGQYVTTGPISTGSNTLTFSEPDLVVVNSLDPTKPGVLVQGTLNINTGNTTLAASPTPCVPTDTDPNPLDYRTAAAGVTRTSRFVVRTGSFDANSSSTTIHMCQTTVYMAAGALPALAGTAPTNNNYSGTVNVGGGLLDWSAPNQETRPACPAQADDGSGCYDPTQTSPDRRYEDLAFWTETGNPSASKQLSQIGGTGNLFVTGIFFLPNAQFNFTGQAVQTVRRDAQFIARRLNLASQGSLFLRPNPANAVATLLGGAILIR